MPPGTIYIYYARGGDSLNVSCGGDGNAVLIKSAYAQSDLQTHQQAIATMTRPQAAASAILAPHAHAMTDVTGFGLAGHLIEILTASHCAATLILSQIPMLQGAVELAAAGHASSIAPANRAAVLGRITGPTSPLLYDPQTGGGLLAAVPEGQAQSLLAQLRRTDPDAAIIGHITAGPAQITTSP